MIRVQTVAQVAPVVQVAQIPAAATSAGDAAPWPLVRQDHRVASGTTIRGVLRRAGLQQLIGPIESGALGLACHGRRAWLDDVLVEGSRVEVLAPITADARADRAGKVAAQRRLQQAAAGTRR